MDFVYYTYRENRTLFGFSRRGFGGDTMSTKYTCLTRPYNSTNIMFEIRNITPDDAGYYNGGTTAYAAWWGGGVVLIVSGKLYLVVHYINPFLLRRKLAFRWNLSITVFANFIYLV